MTISFPAARTAEELRAVPRDDPRVKAAADALWRQLGIGSPGLVLFDAGSLPVFAAGRENVLKLFPARHAEEELLERSVLQRLHGALPVATPAVVASGEIDGWRYLVMRRLPGAPLDRLWASLSPDEQLRLAEQTGRLLAALHTIDPRGLAVPRPDWPGFLRQQAEQCVETQRSRGAPPWCLAQIPGFLEAAAPRADAPAVLLHTEVMGAHLLAAHGPAGWSLTGLVDFEPAMIGGAGYDLASVGPYFTQGNAPALGALLRAYGLRDGELGPALQRRCLAYALLHRYASLRRYLAACPPPAGTDTLDGLAAWWWALPPAKGQ